MTKIETIINLTKYPERYIQNGKSLTSAKEYNGRIIKTTIGITGIICGYKAQKNFWIYWVDTHTLVHHTGIQTSRIVKGAKTDQLAHDNRGIEVIEVPRENRADLLHLARSFDSTIAKVIGPLELGEEQFRQVCNDVAERERARKYNEAIADTAAQDRYDRLVEAIEKLGLAVNEFTLNGKAYTTVVPAN